MPLQMQARSYKAALLTFQPKLTQPKLSVMEQAVREKRKKKKKEGGRDGGCPPNFCRIPSHLQKWSSASENQPVGIFCACTFSVCTLKNAAVDNRKAFQLFRREMCVHQERAIGLPQTEEMWCLFGLLVWQCNITILRRLCTVGG